MDFLRFAPKLVYILGITNLVSLLLVLFSCRCMMGVRLFAQLMKRSWYKRFYTSHCYYWWVFVISVAFHSVLALVAFGNPLF